MLTNVYKSRLPQNVGRGNRNMLMLKNTGGSLGFD